MTGGVVELLAEALVRVRPVAGGEGGTGFLVAPGLMITCAHVLGDAVVGTDVPVVRHDGRESEGRVVAISEPAAGGGWRALPDLAVVEVPVGRSDTCVQLADEWPAVGEDLYALGYTDTLAGAAPTAEPALFRYEGRHEVDGGSLIQLSPHGHVPHGMSGSPVLHLRTGKVCGIVKASRNPSGPTGGWAVPVTYLRELHADVVTDHDRFHRDDRRWRQTAERWPEVQVALFEAPLPAQVTRDVRTRPSVLLRADSAAVPFRGRADTVAELETWCAGQEGVDVRLLTGSGGTGKTRLALELVNRLRARGWAAGFVRREPPGEALRALLASDVPVLLVLDYAEARPDECGDLLDLLANERPRPVRMLLLARAAGQWWNELTTRNPRVEALLHTVTPTAIPVLEPTVEGRRAAFDDALTAFAARLDLPVPTVPPDLSDDRYGLPLDLQMTALAMLLSGSTAEVPPTDPIDYLLKHERRYWRRTAREAGLVLGDVVLERVMTAATLCRADGEDDAARLLRGVPDLAGSDPAPRHRHARWAHEVNPDPVHYLAPLQPDRLGEHLVVEVVSRAPRLLEGLLAEADETQADHALTVLFRTFRQLVHTAARTADVDRFTASVDTAFAHRPDVLQRMAIDRATARYAAQVAEVTWETSPLAWRSRRPRRLDSLYMELRATPTGPGPIGPTPDAVPIAALVDAQRRLFLRGGPGSGKTTSLLWLARRAADRTLRLDGEEVVPFYLPLRNYAAEELPPPDRFADHLAPASEVGFPTSWAQDVLSSGRALLLIDGLDELPSPRRAAVRTWLTELTAAYPDVRYVITSRLVGVRADWLEDLGFAPYELTPLTEDDAVEFVTRWYSSAIGGARDTYLTSVKEDLLSRPQLLRIATNPLMCALLCEVSLTTQHLPDNPIDLIAKMMDVFLDRWDRARGIHTDGLDRVQARAVLQDLAYWQVMNDEVAAPRDVALARAQRVLTRMGVSSPPEQALAYLTERTGLLVVRSPNSLMYTHRAVRDHLAASEILAIGEIPALIERAHLNTWRDLVPIAAYLAKDHERDEIIRRLFAGNRAARSDPEAKAELLRLAATCANQYRPVDPDLRAAILAATRR